MLQNAKPVRHAILFELLRQQNLSQRTTDRLRWRGRAQISAGQARVLQGLAAKSWGKPAPAAR